MSYSFDSTSILENEKRIFPVMGEIHYSRYPKELWKESLLKMKAGGVTIASTYVIWIHHEEIEGQYDFSGQRDLHAFVKVCKECGMKLWLRIGPWVHAEVRNGGFPDWLLKKDFQARTNDERYFDCVEIWYKRIFEEVKDFLYSEDKKDNPIIGLQIENEFGHCGGLYDESGEVHMKRLQEMAINIGFKVPFYTATGWGGARTGGMLPVMGGYCDAPWDQRTCKIEASGNYIFTYERNDHNIGSDFGLGEGITFDSKAFPYLTAELGGGLQMTKHRRTIARAGDIGAVSIVKLGSGVNLLGYYMYHGGTNPQGKLTSLEESKASGSLNDLPLSSYDFNAPVKEYGQIYETFNELKLIFYFVRDFGSELCSLPALIPEDNPLKPDNLKDLRYSYRSDGKKGYVFFNNYVRLYQTCDHKNVEVKMPDGKESLIKLNVLSKDYFFIPFNLDFNGTKVIKTNCSPLCKLDDGSLVFYSNFSNKEPYFELDKEQKDCNFLLLTKETALNCWKTLDSHLILCDSLIIQDKDKSSALLYSRKASSFAIYPPVKKEIEGFKYCEEKNMNQSKNFKPYNFSFYQSLIEPPSVDRSLVKQELIEESDRKKVYRLDLSLIFEDFKKKKEEKKVSDLFVKLFYLGESASLYTKKDGKRILLADNLFSSPDICWEIGLKRFINEALDFSSLELEINNLNEKDQIYLEEKPDFTDGNLCNLKQITFEYEICQEIKW